MAIAIPYPYKQHEHKIIKPENKSYIKVKAVVEAAYKRKEAAPLKTIATVFQVVTAIVQVIAAVAIITFGVALVAITGGLMLPLISPAIIAALCYILSQLV